MIYILNHHSRNARPIVEALGSQDAMVAVMTDHSDYYKVRDEKRYLGVASNYMNIMRAEDPDDWKIILHDDIAVGPNLVRNMLHILKFAPENIISFYNPRNQGYFKAAEKDHHVLRTYKNWWGPCHAFPTDLCQKFVEWVGLHVEPFGLLSEDGMLWRWCSIDNIHVYATLPSLVQHDGFDKSIFGTPGKSGKYLRNTDSYDPDYDVTAVDWKHEFANPYKEDGKYYDRTGIV